MKRLFGDASAMASAAICVALMLLAGQGSAQTEEAAPASPAAQSAPNEASVARDTAHLMRPGRASLGMFAPFRYGLSERWEIGSSLIDWLVLSPNVNFRVKIAERDALTTSLVFGLGSPSGGMWLAQGYLFPSWAQGGGRIGVTLVPTLGGVMTMGARDGVDVITMRADVAFGIRLTPTSVTPLDTLAPLEMALAPVTNGARIRSQIGYDRHLLEWLRLSVAGELFIVPQPVAPARIPFVMHAHAGLEFIVKHKVRFSLGLEYWMSDQRRTIVVTQPSGFAQRQSVLSHDLFPSFDIIWFQE